MAYSVMAKQIPQTPSHIFSIAQVYLQHWLLHVVKCKGQINQRLCELLP